VGSEMCIRDRYELVAGTGYRLRTYWFVFLLVLLGGAVLVSLLFMPYGGDDGDRRTDVAVTGYQFNWSVSPAEVPAGSLVAFNVTSTDVNHGLGLYDPDGHLLGTVQSMPGYDNTMEIRLDTPGEYAFFCMEFCGVNHHRMIRTFTVTP